MENSMPDIIYGWQYGGNHYAEAHPVDPESYAFIKYYNEEKINELLKALKTIEWGRVPGKSLEWATSEQLRDIAREAIAKVEQ